MANNKYSHISDDGLLQNYLQTDDNEWLGILLERYTLLLLGVCIKYLGDDADARDAVQQVFLKVIQEVKKYKIDYFKSWLYMVAKNHCLTLLRDKKNRKTEPLPERFPMAAPSANGLDAENEPHAPVEILKAALSELNEEQRQCVTLFYLEKNSYQQIADLTSYSLLQVKSYIQNGKRNLKLIIEKKMNHRP